MPLGREQDKENGDLGLCMSRFCAIYKLERVISFCSPLPMWVCICGGNQNVKRKDVIY